VHGLYAWLRRHPRLADGVPALGVLALGMIPGIWLRTVWITPLILLLAGAVVFRRSHPVGAFAVGIAAGAIQVATVHWPSPADISLMILLYTLAACRPRRVSLYGLAGCLVGGFVACVQWGMFNRTRPSTVLVGMGVLLAFPLLAWLLGDGVRWRRGYYLALEERAARLERERDALAQVAAAAERAALAVLLGGGLGIGFGAAVIRTMRNSGNGIGTLSMPFGRLALYAVIAAAAAIAAGVLPARRAARTSLFIQN
jgi:hypothetical protein